MSAWRFENAPPPGWIEACTAAGSLFHHPSWLGHLGRGLGARSWYGTYRGGAARLAVTVLHAGPFRIGYAGFPAGGLLGGAGTELDLDELAASGLAVDALRVPASAGMAVRPGSRAGIELPETAIPALQDWSAAALPVLQRDLKKAARSQLAIADAGDPALGDALHALYLATVDRRGGNARYGRAYFRSLLELAGTMPGLRCLAARREGALAGFCVVALDQGRAHYLHGAVDPACRSLGVTDALLHPAIEWARAQGMHEFNLMSSPAAQPGLVRYKEKWGGVTTPHRTFEIDLRPLRARLLRAAIRLHDRLAPWLRR